MRLLLRQDLTSAATGAEAGRSHPAASIALTDLSRSALISALQKNVRLSRPVEALRVAWALLRLVDPSGKSPSGALELLRRLPIIAIEDGLPPPLMPLLTFLMVAHSNKSAPLPLGHAHVQLLLAATLQLAVSHWREDGRALASDDLPQATALPPPALADAAVAGGQAGGQAGADVGACAELSRACLLRAAFGGMPGDMRMLDAAASTWARRAEAGSAWAERLERAAHLAYPAVATIVAEALAGEVAPASPRAPPPADQASSRASSCAFEAELRAAFRGEGGLRWSDVPLSSFDFHCSRCLDAGSARSALQHAPTREALAALVPPGRDPAELAKKAMWACSSSLSARRSWRDGSRLEGAASTGAAMGAAAAAAEDAERRLVAARRAAVAAAATAQAAARTSSSDDIWLEEAATAAAAIDMRACESAEEAALLGRVWRVVAPACRRFACDELRRLLDNEARQRQRQQQLLQQMPPALLLRAPPQTLATALPAAHPALAGLYLVEDFVSAEEEAALATWLDAVKWQPPPPASGGLTSEWAHSNWNSPGAGNDGKGFGANTRSSANNGRLAVPHFEPLPPPLVAVAERMAAVAPTLLEGGTWRPNQANSISYRKELGQYLGAHCDDRQLSGQVLCNLSLLADSVMTYQKDRRPDEPPHKVLLPRRSLQLQTGKVRFDYRHSIANTDLRGPRRISITLRKEKAA